MGIGDTVRFRRFEVIHSCNEPYVLAVDHVGVRKEFNRPREQRDRCQQQNSICNLCVTLGVVCLAPLDEREISMFPRIFSVAAVLALLATPVWAAHCPKDVKAIDRALAKDHGLTAEQLAEVKELRDEGETLHNNGKHGDSIKGLHEAMKILGISH